MFKSNRNGHLSIKWQVNFDTTLPMLEYHWEEVVSKNKIFGSNVSSTPISQKFFNRTLADLQNNTAACYITARGAATGGGRRDALKAQHKAATSFKKIGLMQDIQEQIQSEYPSLFKN